MNKIRHFKCTTLTKYGKPSQEICNKCLGNLKPHLRSKYHFRTAKLNKWKKDADKLVSAGYTLIEVNVIDWMISI